MQLVKKIFFAGSIVFLQTVAAQVNQGVTNRTDARQILDVRMNAQTMTQFYDLLESTRKTQLYKSNIVGSEYFDENFSEGRIVINGKVMYSKDFEFRYNAFSDDIEVKVDSKISYLQKDNTIGCVIGDKTYQYISYKDEKLHEGYVQDLYSSATVKLYLKQTKKFKEGQRARTSLTTDIPPKYVPYESYYLSINGGVPVEIEHKPKKFMKTLPAELKGKVQSYLKTSKIDLKNQEDLLTLSKYIETLL